MKTWLHILLTVLMLALGALSVTPAHALQQGDLVEAQRRYDVASRERQKLFEQLESLEGQYQTLVRKIESLKGQGALGTIGGRIELQNQLTKSKELADQLDTLQTRLRALDNQLAGQRSQLVGGLDRRLNELERSLGAAPAADRGRIVAELNSLRKRRAAYTTPLPSAPNPRDVSSALRLADDAAHPAELMAAADELQDTEDQLRRRLEAIDAKLDELREARTLARRARSFSREERFFEETDRDRVIARYEKVTVTGGTGSGTSSDGNNTAEPTVANGGVATEDDATANSANNGTDADQFDGAAGYGGEAAPSADADRASEEPALSDSPASPTEAPSQDTGGSADPFETTRETIRIDGGTDPSRAVGSFGASGSGLEGQIRHLEGEQSRLKKQANSLRKRAKELRAKAREM